MDLLSALLYIASLLLLASASCDAPSPAYLLPKFHVEDPAWRATTKQIIAALKESVPSNSKYDATSFSVEVTSQEHTLLSAQHTAKNRSELFDGGANPVNDDTRYRIASMTKPFVVLAILQLQKAGYLSLDDPVLKHLPDLVDGQTGSLPWKDITLRALMSQQSGIPRDFAQDDLIDDPETRTRLGLPHLNRKDLNLPTCDELVNYTRTCNITDFKSYIKTLSPLFAPNQHPSYSNINFNLLGLVISKVSNTSFESYVTNHILHPIGMHQTSFTTPPNSVAAICPGGAELYWPFDMGIQNAAGGLYSTSHDLSIWLRYVLSTYNGQTPAMNWFNPTSFSGSIQTFYGTPWEIYRARVRDVVPKHSGLNSTRPLSFITKGGGLPGYSSIVIMLPDYGLGVTVLVVGDAGDALDKIRDIVVRPLIGYAERLALNNLQAKYAGEYVDVKTNSSLTLAQSSDKGLHIQRWLSNGSELLEAVEQIYAGDQNEVALTVYVVPTMLYVNETSQQGERWRFLQSFETPESDEDVLFKNDCVADWDIATYGGRPVNELVFWTDRNDKVVEVELPAWRRVLKRLDDKEGGMLRVQG